MVLIGLAAVALLAWGYWARWVEPAITQPMEFPHKAHMELEADEKLECTSAGCHDRAEKDMVAGRPSTEKCLSCHLEEEEEEKTEEEKKLDAYAESGEEIPWKRVWRMSTDTFLSHRIHVAAKIECQDCHGPIEELDHAPPRALKKLTMADCIDCHETWQWPVEEGEDEAGPRRVDISRKISNDCGACHR